ncbi:hypothetical protein D770_11735 [Flammeovirgaceae bacterium 311]|nr:hypothetical protein D770_11735 [Flammeovirgaceae bacterium 311]
MSQLQSFIHFGFCTWAAAGSDVNNIGRTHSMLLKSLFLLNIQLMMVLVYFSKTVKNLNNSNAVLAVPFDQKLSGRFKGNEKERTIATLVQLQLKNALKHLLLKCVFDSNCF